MKTEKINIAYTKVQIAILIIAMSCLVGCNSKNAEKKVSAKLFEHYFVATKMPNGKDITWGYGTPSLADFDLDGDLDYSFGVRENYIYWFEFKEWGEWQRHIVGPLDSSTLGATVTDIDGDGYPDIVTGRYWYRNPQKPQEEQFEVYQYDSRITSEIHDVIVENIDGDKENEVIVLGDNEGLFWYDIPENLNGNDNWDRNTITLDVLNEKNDVHGSIAPRGVGDLNNDGYADIVLANQWLENKGEGKEWIFHSLPFGKRGTYTLPSGEKRTYGLSVRSWIVDLNNDGNNDIVMSDSDQQDSRIAWLKNSGGESPEFTTIYLPMNVPGVRGSFHSLGVADFNGDNLLDIIAVEQEDPSLLPKQAFPRWYIWENVGSEKQPVFVERVIFDGKLGGHDISIGDVDSDGYLDICSKVWNIWSNNANNGREHADCFRNVDFTN